jgi:hypothetical protein
LRHLAGLVAKQEQNRIGLTDEETALYETNRYENFRRQHLGDRPLGEPDFWITKNAAVSRRQRGNVPLPAMKQTVEPSKAAAPRQGELPTAAQTPSDQPPTRKRAETAAQFFNDKVAEAQGYLDGMRRLLDALGQRLDEAKVDQPVEVEDDGDEIENLIWRYNDAIESAQDAWLRDNLSGDANTRRSSARTRSGLASPRGPCRQAGTKAHRSDRRRSSSLRSCFYKNVCRIRKVSRGERFSIPTDWSNCRTIGPLGVQTLSERRQQA